MWTRNTGVHIDMLGDRFEAGIHAIARWLARLAGGLILIIALIVTGDVLARNLVGRTYFHSFEASMYLFAAALGFGLAYTLASGGNIRIDVVYGLFPRPLRRVLDFLAMASLAALGLFLAWFAWKMALNSLSRGVASNTVLAVPLAVPQAVWALGMTVFGLVGVALALRHAALLVTGRVDAANRLAGIAAEAAEPVAESGAAR